MRQPHAKGEARPEWTPTAELLGRHHPAAGPRSCAPRRPRRLGWGGAAMPWGAPRRVRVGSRLASWRRALAVAGGHRRARGSVRVWSADLGGAGCQRAAQGRHGGLRRRRGVDGAGRAGGSRDAAVGDAALVRPHARRGRAPRRDGRELHRRRGDGGLRDPGRARGRRAARRARGGGDARGGRGVCVASCAASVASSLAVRIGVNTGEAVTGAGAAAGSFTAGDMVNVAARLEQAARPGDILLGRDTFRLVRHAVDAEPVAPLTVKGKSAALEAFRFVAVAPDARGRAQRPRAPMVGRQRERRRLLDAFHQAVADRSCQLLHRARRRRCRQVAPRRRGPGDASTARPPSRPAAACPTATG